MFFKSMLELFLWSIAVSIPILAIILLIKRMKPSLAVMEALKCVFGLVLLAVLIWLSAKG